MSEHAAKRIRERSMSALLGDYRPSTHFRDGLRLWLHRVEDEGGLLVREDAGRGWVRLTIVTAYSAELISKKRWREEPITLNGVRLGPPSSRPWRDLGAPERALAVQRVFEAVAATQDRKVTEYAKALRLDTAIVAAAMLELAHLGLVAKASARRWRVARR